MKRKDLINAENRESMVFLARRRSEMRGLETAIREQQTDIIRTLQWFEHLHGQHAQGERKRIQEKLRQLFVIINATVPPEPPEGKLAMSFTQLEQIMNITYENHYQLCDIVRVQNSLAKQVTHGLIPTQSFMLALRSAREEAQQMLLSIEKSAEQVMDGTMEEVPPEDIEQYRLLIRECSIGLIKGDKVLDISRKRIETILDRRLALAERYQAHAQRKHVRKRERSHFQRMVASGLQAQYQILEGLPPDEEFLVIEKNIFSIKQFAADFASVLLPPATMQVMAANISRVGSFNPSVKKEDENFRADTFPGIQRDFLLLMLDDRYAWIPPSHYHTCAIALQRILKENPDSIFGHVTYYGEMRASDKRKMRDLAEVILYWIAQSPWEEINQEIASPEETPTTVDVN